jgi:hypothetical protein
MDTLFGSEFMNEIEDKATVKVIFTPCRPQDADQGGVGSFFFPPTSTPDDTTSFSGDSTIILTSPESTSSRSSWPDTFQVPRFSYDKEFKLENAHGAFKANGTLLIPDPKLKSDILEGLIQEVVHHKVYLTDRDLTKLLRR